jgi:hypothetical protein
MWPIKEINVTFLRIESDDWFAYLPDTPKLHARAATVKEAFRQLHTQLMDQDKQNCQSVTLPLYNYTFHCTEVNIPF